MSKKQPKQKIKHMTTIRNHVTLIGNIGTSAEVTSFENGKKITRFSLATDKSYRANNGKIYNETEWHRIFAWGELAGFIESYGQKGKKVAIHGRLVNRTYLNREGQKRNITEVELKHIIGLH
jgi:single-strand DNA-binding protein